MPLADFSTAQQNITVIWFQHQSFNFSMVPATGKSPVRRWRLPAVAHQMPFTKALQPSARHVLLASNTWECFNYMKMVGSADGVLPQLWALPSVKRLNIAWLIVKSYSERRVPSNVDLSAGRQEPVPYKRLFRLSFYLLGYLMLRGRVFF